MAISCGKFCVKPLDLGGNNSKSTLPFSSIFFGWNLNVFSQTHWFLGCFRTAKPHFGAGNHHFRWLTSVFRCLNHTVSEFFRRWWPPLAMIIHEPWIRFNGLREKSKSETIEIFRHMEVSSLYFPPKKTLHWKYWNMPSPSTLKSSSLWCWRRCDPCSPDAPDGAHARRGLGHWISPDGIYWGFHGGFTGDLMGVTGIYPPANCHITMENHHFIAALNGHFQVRTL